MLSSSQPGLENAQIRLELLGWHDSGVLHDLILERINVVSVINIKGEGTLRIRRWLLVYELVYDVPFVILVVARESLEKALKELLLGLYVV